MNTSDYDDDFSATQKAGKSATAYPPRSTARYVRRSAQAILASGERISDFKAQKVALIEWARSVDLVLDFKWIEKFDYIGSGAEHRVYKRNGPTKWAVKATYCNRFGHSTEEAGKSASPVEYLKRLAWQNLIFGDDIQVRGVCCDEEHQVEIVTIQPWIDANESRPNPTTQEIDDFMARFTFMPTLPDLGVPIYYSDAYKLVVGDANDRNLIRDVQGRLSPIDLVIGVPGPALLEEILISGAWLVD